LKDAAKPAPTEFVNMSGKAFNTVFPNDLQYFGSSRIQVGKLRG
jgi:hypothetical protein